MQPTNRHDNDLRRQIVSVARVYAQRVVPYREAVADSVWNRAEVEPTALDCSSLVARVCLVVFGDYYTRLGDPSAEVWAGFSPRERRTLQITQEPLAGDLVFYRRQGDPNDPLDRGRAFLYHVAISVGAGRVIAACDDPGCDRVVEHPQRCPHRRWSLLDEPYRVFPIQLTPTDLGEHR